MQHLTIMNTIYCYATHLIMFKYWPLWIPPPPKKKPRPAPLSHCWLQFTLSLDQQLQTVPFHTMMSALWIAVVNPSFIPSNYATKKFVTLILVIFKMCWQISRYLCLWYSVSCLGTHLAQTLWKSGLVWWLHAWHHDWLADDLPRYQQSHFCYSESWCRLIQHLHQK
jgi:hypothetical protein